MFGARPGHSLPAGSCHLRTKHSTLSPRPCALNQIMIMTKIIIMILMIMLIINNHDRDPNHHDFVESSCGPQPHQLRTKIRGRSQTNPPIPLLAAIRRLLRLTALDTTNMIKMIKNQNDNQTSYLSNFFTPAQFQDFENLPEKSA